MISQVLRALLHLHQQHVAFQDVSLENTLWEETDDSTYAVKLCDPGQAVLFGVDPVGRELPVSFRGFVAKQFRPPEVYMCQAYQATKLDCWCLGWCSFCIITGTVLFNSTTPSDADEGWLRAKQHLSRDTLPDLWEQVAPHEAAGPANQFVSSLMSLNPSSRPSVLELCNDKLYQPSSEISVWHRTPQSALHTTDII